MGKTLVVTDIHLNNPRPGYLDAQVDHLLSIYDEEVPDDVVIMGDVFMYRKPSPSVLLGLRRLIAGFACRVWILRGNHDSETKADDGVTALSLFASDKVRVITHTKTFDNWTFIPHYENENKIKEALAGTPKGNTVFGHFGYDGCLNSAGDNDFNIGLSEFNNRTLLGHIHRFNNKSVEVEGVSTDVTLLGPPYCINFGDSGREFYYAVKEWDNDWVFKPSMGGIRHLVYDLEEVPDKLDIINDPSYFTHLRVFLDKLGTENQHSLRDELLGICSVQQLDIKFRPVMDSAAMSSYRPDRNLFSINEAVIDDYIKSCEISIDKDDLLAGYRMLHED